MKVKVGSTTFSIVRGDITEAEVDAIVKMLLTGGHKSQADQGCRLLVDAAMCPGQIAGAEIQSLGLRSFFFVDFESGGEVQDFAKRMREKAAGQIFGGGEAGASGGEVLEQAIGHALEEILADTEIGGS